MKSITNKSVVFLLFLNFLSFSVQAGDDKEWLPSLTKCSGAIAGATTYDTLHKVDSAYEIPILDKDTTPTRGQFNSVVLGVLPGICGAYLGDIAFDHAKRRNNASFPLSLIDQTLLRCSRSFGRDVTEWCSGVVGSVSLPLWMYGAYYGYDQFFVKPLRRISNEKSKTDIIKDLLSIVGYASYILIPCSYMKNLLQDNL